MTTGRINQVTTFLVPGVKHKVRDRAGLGSEELSPTTAAHAILKREKHKNHTVSSLLVFHLAMKDCLPFFRERKIAHCWQEAD